MCPILVIKAANRIGHPFVNELANLIAPWAGNRCSADVMLVKLVAEKESR